MEWQRMTDKVAIRIVIAAAAQRLGMADDHIRRALNGLKYDDERLLCAVDQVLWMTRKEREEAIRNQPARIAANIQSHPILKRAVSIALTRPLKCHRALPPTSGLYVSEMLRAMRDLYNYQYEQATKKLLASMPLRPPEPRSANAALVEALPRLFSEFQTPRGGAQ